MKDQIVSGGVNETELEKFLKREFGGFVNTSGLVINQSMATSVREAELGSECREHGVIPLWVDGDQLMIGRILRPNSLMGSIYAKLASALNCREIRDAQVALNLFRRDFQAIFGFDPGDYSGSEFMLPTIVVSESPRQE